MKEEITQRAFVPLIVPFSLHSSLNPTSSLTLTPQELVLVYLPKKLNTSTETELQLRAEKPFENPQLSKEPTKWHRRTRPTSEGETGRGHKSPGCALPADLPGARGWLCRKKLGCGGGPPRLYPLSAGGAREPVGTAAGSRWEALCISWPVHIPKIHSKRKC